MPHGFKRAQRDFLKAYPTPFRDQAVWALSDASSVCSPRAVQRASSSTPGDPEAELLASPSSSRGVSFGKKTASIGRHDRLKYVTDLRDGYGDQDHDR